MKLKDVAKIIMIRNNKDKITTQESDIVVGNAGGRIGDIFIAEEGEEYTMSYTVIRCNDMDDFNRVSKALFNTDWSELSNGTVMPRISMKTLAEIEV